MTGDHAGQEADAERLDALSAMVMRDPASHDAGGNDWRPAHKAYGDQYPASISTSAANAAMATITGSMTTFR